MKKPRTVLAAQPEMPAHPPLTEAEQASHFRLIRVMDEIIVVLRQQSLDAAVGLAMQAARGEGPLVDHFAELGRRFAGELTKAPPAPRKTRLQVIEGGGD